ncbi:MULTISPECIES: ABC transporter permease [Primorskyibacter]|uniref:Transport permease protein n=1 Tax=Primorskyibacter flagellatus TaxID=1387277 RepID=A0A1W2BWI0_9RHOB|nr:MULTISPECIES: ABC transporter permease [Primorskyibacter]SMC77056.1 ABC-2 type transport system permease protein [Primorskyibacter flagellatus]
MYGIWLREVVRALRDRGQIIGGVSRPLIWLLVLGIGLNPYFRGEVYGEVRVVLPYTYVQFLFPAVIVLNIMYTSILFAVSVIWDRQFGFLREILVSPLPTPLILLAKILGGSTIATVHGSIVLILARFADISLMPGQIALALLAMFCLSFTLTAFGVILANRVRNFEGFGVFSNTLILPLYFTSSSVFPLDPSLSRTQSIIVYPEWLVAAMRINPITYAVDFLRGILIGFNQFPAHIGPTLILLLGLVFFQVALFEFRRT